MLIKDRFEELKNKNFYSRINTEHILELHIGLDEKGRKSNTRWNISGKKLIGINCPVKKLTSAFFAIFKPNIYVVTNAISPKQKSNNW